MTNGPDFVAGAVHAFGVACRLLAPGVSTDRVAPEDWVALADQAEVTAFALRTRASTMGGSSSVEAPTTMPGVPPAPTSPPGLAVALKEAEWACAPVAQNMRLNIADVGDLYALANQLCVVAGLLREHAAGGSI